MQYRTKEEAIKKAKELISLHLKDYTFQLVSRCKKKTAIAECNTLWKRINFVEFFATHMTERDFDGTVLHEIAHGLTPGCGHNRVFKYHSRKIGGFEKCSTSVSYLNPVMPEHLQVNHREKKYTYVCPNGHESKRAARMNRKVSCGRCSRYFDERFLFKLKEIAA